MSIKTILISAAIVVALPLAGCSKASDVSSVSAAADKMQVMDAKANAVLIYADWCSSCKVLDPKVQAAKPMFDGKGISFITIDYTAKDKADLLAQAEVAGVGPAIAEVVSENVKTGQLILVSADGQRVISTVNMTHSPAEIVAKLKAAIASG